MSGEVGGEEPIGGFRFAGMNSLSRAEIFSFSDWQRTAAPLDLEDVTVRAVQDGVVFHREPPPQGVHPLRLDLARLREEIEDAGNARTARQLADADHLQPVVGLEDHRGHA